MTFLKRTGYTFLILQLCILIGLLLGGTLAFPLRLFDDLTLRQTELLYAIVVTLVIAISLFIAAFKDAYDKKQFGPKLLIGSFILIAPHSHGIGKRTWRHHCRLCRLLSQRNLFA